MRKLYTLILVSFSLVLSATAAKPTVPWESKTTSGIYHIALANVEVKIDANTGGRIISVLVDDSTNTSKLYWKGVELLSQRSAVNEMGSTFWPSPQAPWNWPPLPILDAGAYTVNIEGNVLTMTSGLETQSSYNLRVTKKFEFNPADTSLVITYTLTNESSNSQSWAPWEVTRVVSTGFVAFDRGVGDMTGPLYAKGPSRFTLESGMTWYKFKDNIGTSGGEKMMSDGLGWMAYIPNSKNRVLVKRFDDITTGEKAPGESELQIYTAQNNGYTELENQGVYVENLAPNSSLTYTVRWYPKVLPFSSGKFSTADGIPLSAAYIRAVLARGELASGIKQQKAQTSTLFYNPASNILTVETDLSSYTNVEFVAYDLQGKVILKRALADRQQQLYVEGLNKGSYLYQINKESAPIAKGKFFIGR